MAQCPPLWIGSYPDEVHARNSLGARKGSGNRGGGGNLSSPPTGGASGRLEGTATALFDARLLAAAAEGAGVDVRFVWLNRTWWASANSISRKRSVCRPQLSSWLMQPRVASAPGAEATRHRRRTLARSHAFPSRHRRPATGGNGAASARGADRARATARLPRPRVRDDLRRRRANRRRAGRRRAAVCLLAAAAAAVPRRWPRDGRQRHLDTHPPTDRPRAARVCGAQLVVNGVALWKLVSTCHEALPFK